MEANNKENAMISSKSKLLINKKSLLGHKKSSSLNLNSTSRLSRTYAKVNDIAQFSALSIVGHKSHSKLQALSKKAVRPQQNIFEKPINPVPVTKNSINDDLKQVRWNKCDRIRTHKKLTFEKNDIKAWKVKPDSGGHQFSKQEPIAEFPTDTLPIHERPSPEPSRYCSNDFDKQELNDSHK